VLSTADMDGLGPKMHIPDHKLMFQPCENEQEAQEAAWYLQTELCRFAPDASAAPLLAARLRPSGEPATPAAQITV